MFKSILLTMLLGLFCLTSCNPSGDLSQEQAVRSDKELKDPEQIVQEIEKTLQNLANYRCHLQMELHIKGSGMDNQMTSEYDVIINQPRRWAIVQESGMMGATSVSDGQIVTNYMPMMQQYTVNEMTEDWLESSSPAGPAQSMMAMGPSSMPQLLMGKGLAEWLLEGVTESEYVGKESFDGVECHKYEFSQNNGIRWSLWAEVGPEVLLRKIEILPDMQSQGVPAVAGMENMEMRIQLTTTDWDTSPEFTNDDFVFDPPDDAEKVDSMFAESDSGLQEPHALLGEPAPVFQLAHLQGGSFNLEELLGKQIVVLDFWATWCGPCTAALPEIASVSNKYQDKEVTVFAVNQGEEADVVEEYLQQEEIDLAVLLDSEGAVGDQYAVEGIPTTVIIGKDKQVQVVHVGYSGNLESMLSEEIDKLLAGEDLASETIRQWEEEASQQESEIATSGATFAWTVKGGFGGVAVYQQSKEIYALTSESTVVHVDPQGEKLEEIELEKSGRLLRLGNLLGSEEPEFVSMSPWGQAVYACDREGRLLWEYPGGQGVDDVACVDLNGDGLDEVIIGYNGATGLHVLDNQGVLLWKTAEIGNVWHVTGGRFLDNGEVQVLTTSAQGRLHIYSDSGEAQDSIETPIYASMVRLLTVAENEPALALIGGSSDAGEMLVSMDYKGNSKWELELPQTGSSHIDSLSTCSELAQAAIGMRGGIALVVDCHTGETLATISGQGEMAEVALFAGDDGIPILIAATGRQLNAFAIEGDWQSYPESNGP